MSYLFGFPANGTYVYRPESSIYSLERQLWSKQLLKKMCLSACTLYD